MYEKSNNIEQRDISLQYFHIIIFVKIFFVYIQTA